MPDWNPGTNTTPYDQLTEAQKEAVNDYEVRTSAEYGGRGWNDGHTGGDSGGGGGNAPNGSFVGELVNIPLETLKLNAAQQAAQQAYLYERMRLIDIPMTEIEKDKLALGRAQQAWQETYQKAGLTGTFDGAPTLDRERMQSGNALAALQLAASQRGPRNAFVQQAVMSGLNTAGLSRGVDAIVGGAGLPSFQAPQAIPQAASLGALAQDLQRAGQPVSVQLPAPAPVAAPSGMAPAARVGISDPGFSPGGARAAVPASTNPAAYATPSGVPPTGGTAFAITDQNAYANALPAPNKIVSRNWLTLPRDTQDFLKGAYESMGWSANDLEDSIARTLPQFRAPTTIGAIKA